MLFLKEGRKTEDVVVEITRIDEDDEFDGIRCPHCTWRPSSTDRWSCYSNGGPEPRFQSCSTTWNTFSTKGRCPGCSHQWEWTLCLRCLEWARHVDWYERDSGGHD